MATTKHPRVLYFIRGSAPTDEQREEAAMLGNNVGFRNVLHSKEDEALEEFDELAGDPPAWYLAAMNAKADIPAPSVPKADAGALPPAGSPVAPPAPATGGAGAGWRPNA